MVIISRIIVKDDKAPVMVGDKAVCMCGLSKNQPFCDGSHQKTQDEEEGKTYKYNEGGSREEVQV